MASINEETISEVNDVDINSSAQTLSQEEEAFLKDLAQAGAHFGRKHSILNPKMKPYISGQQRTIDIINVIKTAEGIKKAAAFLKQLYQEKKKVIVIGTMPAAWEAVEKLASRWNWFYVNKRWLGGTFTNFKTIHQRLERFEELLSLRQDVERWKKFSSSDRSRMHRTLEKMQRELTGLRKLSELPGAIFVVDPTIKNHSTAVREANRLKIPVVAILNTNGDPDETAVHIPANNRAKRSIDFVVDKIIELMQG